MLHVIAATRSLGRFGVHIPFPRPDCVLLLLQALGMMQFADHKDLLGSGKWEGGWEGSQFGGMKKSEWQTQEFQSKEYRGFEGMYGSDYAHRGFGGTLTGGRSEFCRQYDGLALPDAFLESYYSKVGAFSNVWKLSTYVRVFM